MKKIIAMILALACVFAVSSCGEEEVEKTPEEIAIETVLSYRAASVPTRVQTNTERVYGENYYVLKGETILETGKTADGLVITVQTSKQDKLRLVEEGADSVVVEPIYTEETSEEFLEGSGRRTNGKKWVDGPNFAPSADSIMPFNLQFDKLTDVTYTTAKYSNVLSFTVAEDVAAEVFGANEDDECILDNESDIKVTITDNGAVIIGITIEYTVEEDDDFPGQTVVIDTVYGYELQAPKLVK